MMVSALTFAACDGSDVTRAKPSVSASRTVADPVPASTAPTGPVLAEESGSGALEEAEFETDGSYAFSASCTGGGRLAIRTDAGDVDRVPIPCDGTPVAMHYLKDWDVEVWSVEATKDQTWSVAWRDWTPDES